MTSTWKEELAWAAGFYDGEGCTYNTGGNPKSGARSIGVKVSQVHRESLERFREVVLGVGAIHGPYKSASRSVRASPIHIFQATGLEDCQAVVAMLWPWLGSVKRKQYLLTKSKVTCGYPYSRRKSCGQGHLYIEGTYVIRDDGYGRRCLLCQREYDRKKRARHDTGG